MRVFVVMEHFPYSTDNNGYEETVSRIFDNREQALRCCKYLNREFAPYTYSVSEYFVSHLFISDEEEEDNGEDE